MATLEKIRSKGILLMFVIGGALLLFIIGDFLNSGSSFFNQSKENIAVINGKKIKIQDYQADVEQLTNVFKIENGAATVDENTTEQIRQQVWESDVKNELISEEADKIGLVVNKDEMQDMTIGNNPHPYLRNLRMFANPQTGQFDKNVLINFLSQLDQKAQSPEEQENLDMARSYWLYFEKLIKTSKLEEKYFTLLSKGINANSLETKLAFDSRKNSSDVLYTYVSYSSIPDSKVPVSEDEIAAKYEQVKERYLQKEETRDIKVVAFKLAPSATDLQKSLKWITCLKSQFSTSTDVKSFVNSNSNEQYNDVALSEKEVDPDLKAFAFGGATGQITGPTLYGDTYKMARIMKSGISEPDSIKLKHIVLQAKDSVATKKLADSLMTALSKGANFAMLAQKYSQMRQTAQQGGEAGWISVRSLDDKMKTACLSHPMNSIFTYKDGQAIQILQVEDKTANVRKVKLAVIASEVEPSKETYSKVYNEAKQFVISSTNLSAFEKNARKKGYVVTPFNGVTANDPRLGSINNSREVIRWAFGNEKGTISDVNDCEKEFVIAAVTNVNEKGYKPVEAVKNELKAMIIKDKKAKMIADQIKALKINDINALAVQLRTKVDTASNINFDAMALGNAGFEPAVIANIAFGKQGQISAPVKGNQGVFVYTIVKQVANPAPFNLPAERAALTNRYLYSVYMAAQALKDKADMEDNRANFY